MEILIEIIGEFFNLIIDFFVEKLFKKKNKNKNDTNETDEI